MKNVPFENIIYGMVTLSSDIVNHFTFSQVILAKQLSHFIVIFPVNVLELLTQLIYCNRYML